MSSTNPLFFFNDTATTEIYTLSLHDALPVLARDPAVRRHLEATSRWRRRLRWETGAPGRADGVLTVARWRSPGQLAALREWVAGWPIPLCDRAVRLGLAVRPSHGGLIFPA